MPRTPHQQFRQISGSTVPDSRPVFNSAMALREAMGPGFSGGGVTETVIWRATRG